MKRKTTISMFTLWHDIGEEEKTTIDTCETFVKSFLCSSTDVEEEKRILLEMKCS